MNRRNIVLLTIECLRKDEYQVPANLPNMHRIMKTGLFFSNFYSSSSWTPPSIFSLLTSKYPLTDGGRVSIGKRDLTVAQLLRESGYYTAGLTPGGWLSKFFGFDKGFEDFFDADTSVRNREMAYWRIRRLIIRLIQTRSTLGNALQYLYNLKKYHRPQKSYGERLNTRALRWINDRGGDRPFFIWIHYPETHEPYFPSKGMAHYAFSEMWRVNMRAMKHFHDRKEGDSGFTDADRRMLLDLYRAKLRQVDRNAAGLLDGLSKAGYLDDTTYVFITGDHGQQFFEHGGFGHGMYLYQELCNIPLLIYNRGLEGKEDRRLASGLDIAPTILDLAGVACPPQFCGQSILNSTYTDKDIILQEGRNENKDFIIDRNRVYLDVSKYKIALVSKPYKFIMNSHAAHELYNLEKDPQELNNLAQIDIAVCDELRKRVESHLREVHGSDLRRSMRKKVQLLKSRGRI